MRASKILRQITRARKDIRSFRKDYSKGEMTKEQARACINGAAIEIRLLQEELQKEYNRQEEKKRRKREK